MMELTAAHGGETYYFDSQACKEQFGEDPQKYIRKQTAGLNKEDRERTALPGTKRNPGWLEMLAPTAGRQAFSKADSAVAAKVEAEDGFKRSANYPGAIDWDGPETGEKRPGTGAVGACFPGPNISG